MKLKNIQYDILVDCNSGELYKPIKNTKGINRTVFPNGDIIINKSNSIQESINLVKNYNKIKNTNS